MRSNHRDMIETRCQLQNWLCSSIFQVSGTAKSQERGSQNRTGSSFVSRIVGSKFNSPTFTNQVNGMPPFWTADALSVQGYTGNYKPRLKSVVREHWTDSFLSQIMNFKFYLSTLMNTLPTARRPCGTDTLGFRSIKFAKAETQERGSRTWTSGSLIKTIVGFKFLFFRVDAQEPN